jgi:IMP cyclohydrolase
MLGRFLLCSSVKSSVSIVMTFYFEVSRSFWERIMQERGKNCIKTQDLLREDSEVGVGH